MAASSFTRCGLQQPIHRLVHILKPTGGREGDAGRAMGLNHVTCLPDGIAEIVDQCALLLIRLHDIGDVIDRPAGHLSDFVDAALRNLRVSCLRRVDEIGGIFSDFGFVGNRLLNPLDQTESFDADAASG